FVDRYLSTTALQYSEKDCNILYIILPLGDSKTMTSLIAFLYQMLHQLQGTFHVNPVVQIISLQQTLQKVNLPATLKEIAFSVFNKCRRISFNADGTNQL